MSERVLITLGEEFKSAIVNEDGNIEVLAEVPSQASLVCNRDCGIVGLFGASCTTIDLQTGKATIQTGKNRLEKVSDSTACLEAVQP